MSIHQWHALADHEAGHAVVALALGVEIEHVRLIRTPDDRMEGETWTTMVDAYTGLDVPLLHRAAVAWGGLAATVAVSGAHDLRQLAAYGPEFVNDTGPGSARQLAQEILTRHYCEHAFISATLAEAGRISGVELAQTWAVLVELADEDDAPVEVRQ